MSFDHKNCISSCLKYLPENPLMIDVGCNINPIVEMNNAELIEGWNDDFTFLFLNQFPKAQCIGIEPLHWQTYEKKWQFDNRVKLFKIGLSDKDANEYIIFPGEQHVVSSFYMHDLFKNYSLKLEQVACKKLDTFFYELNLEKIDYLKIDTEGAEYKILCGAQNILKENKIIFVQFEYGLSDPNNDIPSVELICDLLSSYGYEEILTSGREKVWKIKNI